MIFRTHTSRRLGDRGFTLIEVMLVLGITSLLAVTAFVGQRWVLERAGFDAAITETVQDITYARNYAMSNVGETSVGTTLHGWAGGPVLDAGDSFEFDPLHTNHLLTELEPVYDIEDASGNMFQLDNDPYDNGLVCADPRLTSDCEAYERYFSALSTTDYTVYQSDGSALPHGLEIFYWHQNGGLKVCTFYDERLGYLNGCAANLGTVDLLIKNSDGMSATIRIDGTTGIPTRVN